MNSKLTRRTLFGLGGQQVTRGGGGGRRHGAGKTTYWAPNFGKWYATRGAEGEEPPPKIREIQVLWDELQAAVNEDDRIDRGQRILWSHDENLWMIEVARTPFTPVVRKNHLINVLDDLTADYQLGNENFARQDQFFFAN